MESVKASDSKSDVLHGSYTVKPGDSLMSIAARVGNVTPVQLARFNRLGMLDACHPPLFPGQRLYIPNQDEISAQNVRLRHLPGAATRVHCLSADISDPGNGIGDSSQRSNEVCYTPTQDGVKERLFVKVRAKRVLLPSKREIDGVLIFTPDAVCFDAVATASALNRAMAAKRHSLQHLPSVASYDDSAGDGEAGSPLAHSPPKSVMKAARPVHDVLALSVCIPIAAVVSLNTHGDMNNLLSGCRSKTSNEASLPKNLPISTEIEVNLPDKPPEQSKAPSFSSGELLSVHQSMLTEGCEQTPLPEEVFISIGIDVGRICAADSATLCEAATSSLHVFKIPLNKLADIHDILVSATNSAANQPASSDLDRSRNSPPNLSSNQKLPSVSIIESALEEMEKNTMELNLVGDKSCILTEEMLKDLAEGLPANRVGSAMRLVFSTAKDGFSLNTLYRKTKYVQDVNLLLILDQQGVVFGALLSEKMHCSQRFYGTGESCVFHWREGFKCYNWTKKNYFFMQGSHDSFLIGAKSGHSAIWFDGDLKYGRSEATDTFDNPVLCSMPTDNNRRAAGETSQASTVSSSSSISLRDTCGPSSVAFVISALEVWEMIA
ncbi:TLD domain-containing protein 2 [Taenia crassiceps]|uniref:Oxidation resistance protein 1 n=1 Tax=Taenia crassiceps TaxID=6207 RepID=A0ABR4QLC3_9CEST